MAVVAEADSRQRNKLTTLVDGNDEQAVAVIGLACRFPADGSDPERFWQMLCDGRSAYSKVPTSRFKIESFHKDPDRDRLNTISPRGGHFLQQDIGAFDANFFSIGQNEAAALDPQQRIMLETVYEAMENAGLPMESVAGTDTGCFVGNFLQDFREMLLRDPEMAPLYSLSGSGQELISNRISWFYDFKGPSFTIGTACSSSLVALHQACQSIRTRECSMAVVAGSNILLNPESFAVLSNQKFLSPSGTCRSFDAAGDGYGRGEGFAALIVKNVNQALQNGDPIRAIVRGTGVNQNGRTKVITRPSADAQADLIRSVYQSAGLKMDDTNYFEAHGTGTKAGDPLELEAISSTLCRTRGSDDPLTVGSVKSNIGHLESTSGLAGVIKSIYVLENGLIPPNINFEKFNPRIPFRDWKITIPTTLRPWPTNGLRRCSVGWPFNPLVLFADVLKVQGFGYGGTNAHVILDDAFHFLQKRGLQGNYFTQTAGRPSGTDTRQSLPRPRLFVLTAQDKQGLNRQARALAGYIQNRAIVREGTYSSLLRDLSFTLAEKRSTLAWRAGFRASSSLELLQKLTTQYVNQAIWRKSKALNIGFIFTGQGAQWPRMGLELLQYRVFRESIQAADEFLRKELGCSWSVVTELSRESSSNINLPNYSQPLCTIIQMSLVNLLESWNIKPSAVIGHSSGEIAAAYCLGALSRHDAWRISYIRGLLSAQMGSQKPPMKGGMLAVGLSDAEAERLITQYTEGEVMVACINSPSSVTISGHISGIDTLEKALNGSSVFARRLQVETAYHSTHMESISVPYLDNIRDVSVTVAHRDRKMYSTVTGGLIDPEELGPIHWVRNLVSPVQFYDAMLDLLESQDPYEDREINLLVEVGPHSALKHPVNQIMQKHGILEVPYCSVLSQGQNAIDTAQIAACDLFTRGVPVRIPCVNDDVDGKFVALGKPLVDLPPYAWNHSNIYWAESRISKQYRSRQQPSKSLIGAPCPTYGEKEQMWRGVLRLSEESWMMDHKIYSSTLYPAAGYLAMAVEGASQLAPEGRTLRGFSLRDVQIIAPAVIREESPTEFILQIRPHHEGTRADMYTWQEFTVSSCSDTQNLRKNCYGLILTEYEPSPDSAMSSENVLEAQRLVQDYEIGYKKCNSGQDVKGFYEMLDSCGLNYGPSFRNVTEIRSNAGQSCCEITIPQADCSKSSKEQRPHHIHPSTLDAMFHTVYAAFNHGKGPMREAMVPKSIDKIYISGRCTFEAGSKFKGVSKGSAYGLEEMVGDMIMLDGRMKEPSVVMKRLICTAVTGPYTSRTPTLEMINAGRLYSKLVWKPLLDCCTMHHTVSLVQDDLSKEEIGEATENYKVVGVLNALKYYPQLSIDDFPAGQQEAFLNWLNVQEALAPVPAESGAEARASSTTDLTDPGDKRRLADLAFDQESPWDFLQSRAMLKAPLAEQSLHSCVKKIAKYASLLAHANPKLSILEMASLGYSWSTSVLLSSEAENFKHADFTLVTSDTASEATNAKLRTVKAEIKHVALDVARDLEAQIRQLKALDLIILSDFLLPPIDPRILFATLRGILKPGGKLCLLHQTGKHLFPTKWLEHTPLCLTEASTLMTDLESNDFVIELDTVDSLLSDESSGLLIARADPTVRDASSHDKVIILQPLNLSNRAVTIIECLETSLEALDYAVQKVQFGHDLDQLGNHFCVSLLELEFALLSTCNEETFVYIQSMLLKCQDLLWVTAFDDPAAAVATGLLRCLRNEVPGSHYRTINIVPANLDTPRNCGDILASLIAASTQDYEFREEGGLIKIGRFVQDPGMIEEMCGQLHEDRDQIDHIDLGDVEGTHRIIIQNQGFLDSLCLEAIEDYGNLERDILDDEVEMEVKATGLNFRDVMVLMGQIPDNSLGFEASGVIRRCGRKVADLEVGDQVYALGQGMHQSRVRIKAILCQRVPVGMSLEEAATLPLVHCTAYHALVNIAKARPGQTVLIHAAAGGVGQAAMQLAKHLGLEIYATVGTPEKQSQIESVFGIYPDHIFNSRDLSFAKGIMRTTNGRGVDIILNSLAGEALRQSWHCIAPFGSFIEIGMKDALNNTGLEMQPFLQDATFYVFNLKHLMLEKTTLVAEMLVQITRNLRDGIIRPVRPLTIFPVSEMERAFRSLQRGKHQGKVALAWTPNEKVRVLRTFSSNSLRVNENATFLLVGGLGGIGRSLANLLADCGAKFLCFISRSGVRSGVAQNTVAQLEARGVTVKIYKCDAAHRPSMALALQDCDTTMPPIRGVLQCATALQDAPFERMTYKQWVTCLGPKVQGSWNLHELLPPDLDFFIMLSSFAALFGNRTQGNYAAAGAYQDALAHYRRQQGLKAVSIDFGIVRDVGMIAEKGTTEFLKRWEEPFGMRETELHTLIKTIVAIETGQRQGSIPPQIIHGLPTAETVRKAGIPTPWHFADPRFSVQASHAEGGSTDSSALHDSNSVAKSLKDELVQMESVPEAKKLIADALVMLIARYQGVEKLEIDENRPLYSYGVDSLLGIEIANWIYQQTKVNVSLLEILAARSIVAFAEFLAGKSELVKR